MLQEHMMTDIEWGKYKNTCISINNKLDGLPKHLVIPILVKVLVSTGLTMQNIQEGTPGSRQLHDNLIFGLTEQLTSTINKFVAELN